MDVMMLRSRVISCCRKKVQSHLLGHTQYFSTSAQAQILSPSLECQQDYRTITMATSSSPTSSSIATDTSADSAHSLLKLIRSHEVSIAEFSALSSSRTIYQKNGSISFRTSVQRATASEQKQLETAKAKLQKVNIATRN